jgi:hypothetical protein
VHVNAVADTSGCDTHVDPCWHKCARVTLASSATEQVTPDTPGAQAHGYAATLSLHVPPFSHGDAAHSSMSTVQCMSL